VKIDDNPADQAIRRLVKSTAVGKYGIDPNIWFKTITRKINLLKEVENHFAATLIERSNTLMLSARNHFIGYLVFIIAILTISIGFGMLILHQLKKQTDQILDYNKHIADGDLSTRIPIDSNSKPDELISIAISMNSMVESLAKARKSRLQAMKDLEGSEFQIRSVLETAPDVIISLDDVGDIEAINPAGENLFGYYPGSLCNNHISQLIPSFQANNNRNSKWHADLLDGGKVTNVQLERDGVCQDEGIFPIEVSMSGYLGAEGQQRYTLIVKDITERKQAKMALDHAYRNLEKRVRERTIELERANEKMFVEIDERIRAEQGLKLASKVFENANEGIIITDETVNIIKVNRAFSAISGFTREEMLGQNPNILTSGRHDKEFFEEMWDTIHKNGEWSGEIWNRRKQGQIFPQLLSITTVWNRDNKLTNYVGIFSDITQIKETEERLEKMAYFDALTDLPNRVLFKDRLEHELEQAARQKTIMAVLFIDLDRFKHVTRCLSFSPLDGRL
jgi:PAS domain S-box-containing protein